jgi:hypothetical protein
MVRNIINSLLIIGLLTLSISNFSCEQKPKPAPSRTIVTSGDSISIVLSDRDINKLRIQDHYSIIQSLSLETIGSPVGFPPHLAWRPNRHFGPFTRGSTFANIQVKIGRHEASVYFNKFFIDCIPTSDRPIYIKYFEGDLPTNRTPFSSDPPTHVPGNAPSVGVDGPNDILFELKTIYYTSKFGGSIKLEFEQKEDYEYEVRNGEILWDLKNTIMNIYVIPAPSYFNPILGPELGGHGVRFEFLTDTVTTYEDNSISDDNRLTLLKSTLLDYGTSLETLGGRMEFRKDIEKFVYGFIHTQFQSELEPDNKVDMIELTDNFIDLHNRPGTTKFRIDLKINSIFYTLSNNNKKYDVEFSWLLIHNDGSPSVSVRGLDPRRMRNGEGTAYMTVASMLAEECRFFGGLAVYVYVGDRSDWETVGIATLSPDPDCDEIERRVDSNDWGPGPEERVEGVPIYSSSHDDPVGTLSYSYRTNIFVR